MSTVYFNTSALIKSTKLKSMKFPISKTEFKEHLNACNFKKGAKGKSFDVYEIYEEFENTYLDKTLESSDKFEKIVRSLSLTFKRKIFSLLNINNKHDNLFMYKYNDRDNYPVLKKKVNAMAMSERWKAGKISIVMRENTKYRRLEDVEQLNKNIYKIKDKDKVLELIKRTAINLKFCNFKQKLDKDIVFEAYKQDPIYLNYADKSLRSDREFMTMLEAYRTKQLKLRAYEQEKKYAN